MGSVTSFFDEYYMFLYIRNSDCWVSTDIEMNGFLAIRASYLSVNDSNEYEGRNVKMSHEKFQQCIEECLRCMVACNHCYTACLGDKNVEMMKDCIRLDRECADICAYAAQAMSINSSYAMKICSLCAEVCKACGNECKKHDSDHCQQCADACFACAKVCQSMAA